MTPDPEAETKEGLEDPHPSHPIVPVLSQDEDDFLSVYGLRVRERS